MSNEHLLVFGEPTKAAGRFSEWVRSSVREHEEELKALGIRIGEIETHSFRKGIATSLANCPGGPSAISIWLRAGWSLGNVQSRYIFQWKSPQVKNRHYST